VVAYSFLFTIDENGYFLKILQFTLCWNAHSMLKGRWSLSYNLRSCGKKGLSNITGSAIPDFCKKLKGAALHSSVFSSSLKIILRCNSTAPGLEATVDAGDLSHCMPLKHLHEEWQGKSSHSPAATPSHWPLFHHRHYQRWGESERQPQLPQIVQECFHLVPSRTWCRHNKFNFYLSVIWFYSVLDAAESHSVQAKKKKRQVKWRNVCREEWYKIAADKHSLVHPKWC